MNRRIPFSFQTTALIILILLTILRWELIWKSTLTLVLGLVLKLLHPDELREFDSGRLTEFWAAAIVWWFSLCFLAQSAIFRWVIRRHRNLELPHHEVRGIASLSLLIILTFISLTSPFLTPVPPNSQGNLATSRLLPPLAQGVLFESPVQGAFLAPEGIKERYGEAAGWLLSRHWFASGNKGADIGDAVSESQPAGKFLFLFGTDDNGRDVLSRVIVGARVSLGIGVVASLLAVAIGSLVGFMAGMGARPVDFVLMRLTDLALAIPGLFLAIGLMAFLGQSLMTLVIVLACTGWMAAARVVRGEVSTIREREFILSARLLGVPTWRIVIHHMLPNMTSVLVSMVVLQFANVVLAEAALGFLGLGIQPPTATWGNMMGEAMGTLRGGWWVGLFPGAFLASVLVAAHDLAEARGSRDSGDVRGRYDQPSIQDHQ